MVRPYPDLLRAGMNTTMDKNLARTMQRYRYPSLSKFSVMTSRESLWLRTLTPTSIPATRKMVVSATQIMYFQNECTVYFASEEICVLPKAAMYSPMDTNAIIPLTLNPRLTFSATKYKMKQLQKVILRVKMGSFLTLLMRPAAITPNRMPRRVPPIVRLKKSSTMLLTDILLPDMISAQMVKSTIHVPSLSKDSPSMSELNFLGAPTSLRRDSTATVSVQLKMAPNIKAPTHVQYSSVSYPISSLRLSMMRQALTTTDGKARMNICLDCFRKMCQSELKPLSKISGGRKIIRMPCGLIFETCLAASPSIPRFFSKNPTSSPIRNSSGVQGTLNRLLSSRTMAPISSPITRKNTLSDSLSIQCIQISRTGQCEQPRFKYLTPKDMFAETGQQIDIQNNTIMKGTIKLFMVLGASIFLAWDVVYLSIAKFEVLGLTNLFKTKDISNLEGKLDILLTSLFYLGLFVLTTVLFVIASRILSVKVDPIRDDIPPMVKCGNQILSNTIEQAVVFYGFYFYWLNAQKTNKQLKLAIIFPSLFIVGRILFAVGYIIGIKVGVSQLRAAGFVVNLLTVAAILADVQGLPFITKYFA